LGGFAFQGFYKRGRFTRSSWCETKISLAFIQEQLHAVPFVVVLSSGDRYNVKTADHADLPPVDEQSGERPP
jgi:hypothetical protein